MAGSAGWLRAWRPARLRAPATNSSLYLLSLAAQPLAHGIALPEIRAAFPGQTLRLGPPPGAYAPVIARHQHLRHRPALPNLRARIVRVFEQPLGKTLLRQ